MNSEGKGRISSHGDGAGDVTEKAVEQRAREIASIRGRPTGQVYEDDRADARAELHGERPSLAGGDEEIVRGSATRDPSEPLGVSGRQVQDQEADDESAAADGLASEGVEEAQHDQMLAARKRERESRRE